MFMLKRRSTIRRQEKRKPTHGGPYLHVKRRASAKRRAGHHQKPLPETHGHKLRRVTLVLPPPSIRGQFAATRPPSHHPPSTIHAPPPPLLSCAQAHGRRLLSGVHCSWQAEGTPPVQPSQPTQVPPPVPSQLFPPPPPPRPSPSHGAPVRRQDGKRNRRAHRRPCRDPRATAPPSVQGPIAERGHPHVPAPPAPRTQRDQHRPPPPLREPAAARPPPTHAETPARQLQVQPVTLGGPPGRTSVRIARRIRTSFGSCARMVMSWGPVCVASPPALVQQFGRGRI